MKKFLISILFLLISNNLFAKPIYLECIDDEPIYDNEDQYTYLSVDLGKKKFGVIGTKTILKGECLIGKCESVELYNRDMPFISEDYEYLKIGEEEKNYITLNKQTGGVVWYSYYWEEIGSTNTFKQIDNWGYYSCKATKELPF